MLTVCDDGIGVEPAILDNVFDPFVSSKREGVGLGSRQHPVQSSRATVDRVHLAPREPAARVSRSRCRFRCRHASRAVRWLTSWSLTTKSRSPRRSSMFLADEGHEFRIASSADEGAAPDRRASAERRVYGRPDAGPRRRPGAPGDPRAVPRCCVVMMTAYGTSQTSIDAIRAGAFDYLTKPLDLDLLRTVIAKALAAGSARRGGEPAAETQSGRWRAPDRRDAGDSGGLQDDRPAGDQRCAGAHSRRARHRQAADRQDHPRQQPHGSRAVRDVDCESMPEAVLEAALLAARRRQRLRQRNRAHAGAPAVAPRPGADLEIGTAGPDGQRLCRQRARPDGSAAIRAASRELYDVLSVITLRLPPLRERRGNSAAGPPFHPAAERRVEPHDRGMDDQVLRRLQEHPWPGNVGELERVVKRACIVARGDVITTDEIADTLTDSRFDRQDVETALSQARARRCTSDSSTVRRSILDAVSRHHRAGRIDAGARRLTITNGNQVKAADILGVNRATLRKKMPES